MPFERKDPLVELEEMARQTADKLIASIVRRAKSEEEVQVLVSKVIGWMHNELNRVEWSAYTDKFGVNPAQQGYQAALRSTTDPAAKRSAASAADLLDDDVDDNPTRPIVFTPSRPDGNSQ
jgi:hypothetical protein